MKGIAKMIATLESVTKRDGGTWDVRDERLSIVGRQGCVTVSESERRYPGMQIATFDCMSWVDEDGARCGCVPSAYWRTSPGSSAVTPEGIVMATCNSIYYFIRLDDAELDEYLRGWGHDRAWFERLLLASAGPGAVPWVHDPKIEDGLPLYDFGIR